MNLFCHHSILGVKSLIEHHFWKYEFTMENVQLYSTFLDGTHFIMILNLTDATISVCNSINRYKLRNYEHIAVFPFCSIGNDIHAFKVNILSTRQVDSDEESVYEGYDCTSTHCVPNHTLFFNSVILSKYNWEVLQQDIDYRLLNLNSKLYTHPFYIVENTPPFQQILCNRNTACSACNHMCKRMKHISGGYKEILFDITTESAFACPCSFFKHINKRHSNSNFNFILLSYRMTQFYLHF